MQYCTQNNVLIKMVIYLLQMDEVGITEYVKGDNRKFEIWYGEKEEIYIVQVGHLKVILEILNCRCKSLNL